MPATKAQLDKILARYLLFRDLGRQESKRELTAMQRLTRVQQAAQEAGKELQAEQSPESSARR